MRHRSPVPALTATITLAALTGAFIGPSPGSSALHAGDIGPCTIQTTIVNLDPVGFDSGASFGHSVAVAGEWIAVSAPAYDGEPGRVEAFRRIDGVWTHHAILTPSDSAPNDFFGWEIALDMGSKGGTLLVGAIRATGILAMTGAAYIFELDGESWIETAKLIGPDSAANDFFGYAVDVGGDVAVIGVRSHDAVAENAGAAYVFERSSVERDGFAGAGELWTFTAKLIDPEGTPSDLFGGGVQTDGSLVAIGVPGDDPVETFGAGSVHLFERSKAGEGRGGAWERLAVLRPIDAFVTRMGDLLQLQGSTLIASAYYNNATGSPAGGIVFEQRDGVWAQQRHVTTPVGETIYIFRRCVALGPDGTVAVWSRTFGASPGINVIHRDQQGWTTENVIATPEIVSGGTMSVAFDGQSIVGGRPFTALGGVSTGRAFVSTVPPRDRDGDGLDDDCELRLGLDEDCDADGIIDSVQVPFRFTSDSAPPEFEWIIYGDIAILAGFTTTSDHQTIREISWYRPMEVSGPIVSATALVYIDPFDSGTPRNATLVLAQTVEIPFEGPQQWVTIPIPAVDLGPAGTSFYYGLLFASPVGVFAGSEGSIPHRQTSWSATSAVGQSLDPKDLDAVSLRPWEISAQTGGGAFTGVTLLRAALSDCDESGRLDLCEIAEGELIDSDGDGVADVCTPGFNPFDLDGDGSVDGADLALVIAAWGACPGVPSCAEDFNGDGEVSGADLGSLIAAWTG